MKAEATLKVFYYPLLFCGLAAGPAAGQADQSRLVGDWQLTLRVTGPAEQSAGPRAASGRIALHPLELPPGSSAQGPVYSVAYDTTLHAMFGKPRFGPAQATLTGEGRVELAFNPLVDHGAFRLTGVARGDSVTGEWQRTGFADDGYRGSFTMVRQRQGSARTPAETAAAASVRALVARYDSAWNRRDTAAVSRLLAPGYQYFSSRGGVSSRAETMTFLTAPDYVLENARRSEIEVTPSGPAAIVSSRWQGKGTYRREAFNDDQRCGQTWLRTDGKWQLLSEHCVQITRN